MWLRPCESSQWDIYFRKPSCEIQGFCAWMSVQAEDGRGSFSLDPKLPQPHATVLGVQGKENAHCSTPHCATPLRLEGLIIVASLPGHNADISLTWTFLGFSMPLGSSMLPNQSSFNGCDYVDSFPCPNPSMISVYLQTQRHILERGTEPWGCKLLPPTHSHILVLLCNLTT